MNNEGKYIRIKLIAMWVIAAISAIAFYFLCGEEIKYRDSYGNIEMQEATGASIELVSGASVEQQFYNKIEEIEEIDIQWGTFYRNNIGKVVVRLIDVDSGYEIIRREFNASEIQDASCTNIKLSVPLKGYVDKILAIKLEADSQEGQAVTPMLSTNVISDGLYINGIKSDATLCYSVLGKDLRWLGVVYWYFFILYITIVFLFLVYAYHRYTKGKQNWLICLLLSVSKYKYLIRQLVKRDFKIKYKRSVLGFVWSILNPMLMMAVQYFVFSTIFKSNVSNYAVYLLIGIVIFNFFNEACSMTMLSIVGNVGLINKVYVPKFIYPVTRVMSSLINLGMAMIPLVIVSVISGIKWSKAIFLTIIPLGSIVVFSLGLGMILASSMVFFRDTQFLWNVLSTMWMYATPIFYTEDILPEGYRGFLLLNPLYHFFGVTRMAVLEGKASEPREFLYCIIAGMAMLLVGSYIFKKTQDKFTLYL